jgi:hypothetical protein
MAARRVRGNIATNTEDIPIFQRQLDDLDHGEPGRDYGGAGLSGETDSGYTSKVDDRKHQ